ncbi:MAG: RNA-directed DNA polymerase, partial [Actinomycetota bacterium]
PPPAPLRLDVADCFRSICPRLVERALLDLDVPIGARHPVLRALEGFASIGIPGLPVGPLPSAVLANAVLAGVDRALAGARWLRWVDDVVLFASDPASLAGSEADVIRALGRIGLAPHPGKRRLAIGSEAALRLALARASLGVGEGAG